MTVHVRHVQYITEHAVHTDDCALYCMFEHVPRSVQCGIHAKPKGSMSRCVWLVVRFTRDTPLLYVVFFHRVSFQLGVGADVDKLRTQRNGNTYFVAIQMWMRSEIGISAGH